jgi:hypothetical protein
VKAFVDEHRGLFGHGAEAFAAAKLQRSEIHGRLRTTVWQQQLDGIPVFEAIFKAHSTVDGELVNLSSGFVPDLAKAAAKGTPGRAARLANPTITAPKAVALAAKSVGEGIAVANIVASEAPAGAGKKQHFRAPKLLGVSTEYLWLPLDDETLRLCWQVQLVSKARGEMFLVVVDAEAGEVVIRRGLTNYLTDASYRVFTSDSPSPFSPGHSTQLDLQPTAVARTLVTTPALNTTASPNGWIDDGGNETRGNNVDAHLDLDANDVADLPRPQGSPNRVFDFPLDLAQEPTAYRDAAVTQLFYVCNWMHDKLYELGFTEEAGNFQNDTFGRGGNGNDAVEADAQDGSGTNNANFSTPFDGSPGRMQMYVFPGPTPDRDGDFDIEIVLHEYTHGLSNRLVGGGVGISQLQTGGMGEGWSDFYGLALLSEPGDDLHACYAAGGYATWQFFGLTTNYYSGIRRYPYSTDLSKNPLTLKDIDPTKASPHDGIPRSPIISNTADEVHNMGEVWCVTLWEVRANLIAKHGYAVGNQLTLQLVTDGMKLAPANPNFLEARDAIVQADLVLSGGANQHELWAAFAKRGMGASAIAPNSSTAIGVFEAYDLPDDLSISPLSGFTISANVAGPFPDSTVTLLNSGTAPMNWTATRTQPWLALSAYGGTLAPGESIVLDVLFTSAASALSPGNYQDVLTFTNLNNGVVQTRSVALAILPITDSFFFEGFETGVLNPTFWNVTGTGNARTLITGDNGPHNGALHLTMDSSVDNTYARNELTLTLNLAGRHDVRLRFWAAMFNDEPEGPPSSPFTTGANFDGVAISLDGVTWYEARGLRDLGSDYAQYNIDLDAAIAAHGWSYSSAFRIRFNHYDNYSIPTDGFVFDDIEVVAAPQKPISLSALAEVTEGVGPFNGTVSVLAAPASNLVITLLSSDPSELTVPPTVTILAGQTSAVFPITILDDNDLDGTQNVAIVATSAGYGKGVRAITVRDNETATLTLSIPAAVSEGAGTITGTVTIDAPAGSDITVSLASSDLAAIHLPTSAIINAGQTSAIFTLTVIDDTIIDGLQNATITAEVAGWTGANAAIDVQDDENLNLTLTLPGQVLEGTPLTGIVGTSGTVLSPLTVALSSNNATQVSVPATVTIATGASSATFLVTAVNDTAVDGTQNATITASAAGFADASGNVSAIDNEIDHFAVADIPTTQIRNVPFATSIAARNIDDVTITNYNASVNFTAAGTEGVVPINPSGGAGFVNGVRTGNLSATAFGTNVVLTVSDSGGHSGTSNAFNVGIGAVDHFGWNAISSPRVSGVPFTATVTAQDLGNNTVPTFLGSAALNCGLPTKVTGAGTTTWDFPLFTYYHDARTQCIYLPAEIGSAGRITALSLYVTTLPGQPMNAWTIRMKHTTLASYTSPAWDTSGWTVVHQSVQNIATTGWVTFPLSTPFDYNGTNNLLVDFSFNNDFYTTSGASRTTSTGSTVRTVYNYSDSFNGDPLTWSGTNPTPITATQLPNLRVQYQRTVPMTPVITGNFTAGAWTGPVSVNQIVNGITLGADNGTFAGESNVFSVSGSPILSVTPATDLISAGNVGGPFIPAGATYTVSNTGAGPMTWTATKNAAWLSVAPASGTLAVGASATVTATIAAATLDPGLYTDTLSFNNTSSALGNSTRAAALTVTLPAPLLVAEPPFTGGFSNSVSWSSVSGASGYEIEQATAADFSDAAGSGPLSVTNRTFSNLTNGTLYRYRVRSRRALPGILGPWSQTTQGEFDTGVKNSTASTGGGEVVLATGASVSLAGRVANPSFEGGALSNWISNTNSPGMGSRSTNGSGFAPLPTLGTYYAGLNTFHNTARTAGEYIRLTQAVDLTNVTTFLFDAQLGTAPGSTWSNSARAEFRIDGTTLWSSTTPGSHLNQSLDLSGYTGTHTIEFRQEVILSGTFHAQWFCFDNVRVIGPGYITSGTLISPPIAPGTVYRWNTLTYTRDLTAQGSALTVDVLSANDTVLATNLASGTNLNSLPTVANQPSLKLRASLSTTNSANTPRLLDWTVNYQLNAALDALSAWSAPVTSTQDAAGPSVTLPLVVITPGSVSGTAFDPAGVASLSVNGIAASTSDGFAHWTVNLPLAPGGGNAVSVSATDGAEPPNSSSGSSAVFLATMAGDADSDGLPDAWEAKYGLDIFSGTGDQGPLGDFDHDGLENLLERALGLDPSVSQAVGLPVISREINPLDSAPYLTLRYHRLLAPGALLYSLDVSADLQTWHPATATDFEEAAPPTANADGFTETVTLRLKPSLITPGHTAEHVRLRVSLP